MEIHRTLGDKVRIYRRAEGGAWHCSTYLKGKEWRRSTKERSLARAKDIAEDWYLELCGKDRAGELRSGKTFAQVARKFEEEYEAITHGHRSPKWVQGHKDRIRLHLLPYFGNKVISEITSGAAQEYRVHRMTPPKDAGTADSEDKKKPWTPPARNTIHNGTVRGNSLEAESCDP
jgi:Phage integrase, N-terminal SAM-like domain